MKLAAVLTVLAAVLTVLAAVLTVLAAAAASAQTCGNGLTAGPVDPALVDPCISGCTQTAAASVPGCNPLDRACICGGSFLGSTMKDNFYKAVVNCLINNRCNTGNAQTISNNTCQYGFCNVVLPSGATRKRAVEKAKIPQCPQFHKNALLVQGDEGNYDGFECIDTLRDLESCGGCPDVDGIDCTALPGASDVSCVLGQCKVHACDRGFTLVNGECVY
ncbi:Protein priA [Vanrija pseudolonga]|uniref:Protein priA n=1 Tax=Vanrija pseudolonga TaxID=143232 RepID=A0AAF0YDT2_9TREE|nr:Protein priA [Vanrija pseudolonga]